MFLTRPQIKENRRQEDAWAILDGNIIGSDSGELVSIDKSMMQTTNWACVRIISESIAQLPIQVQQKNGTTWVDVPDHQALELLFKPNNWQTQHDFIAYMVVWSELHGNAFCFKRQGRTGPVLELIPIRGDKVTIKQDKDFRISYHYNTRDYTSSDLLHLRNYGTESYQGLSTIANARNAIGLAMAMEKHGSRLFKNAASVGLTIETPGELGEAVYERLDTRLRDKYSGANRAHKTLILEGGAKAKAIGMSNTDSQWLEAKAFSKSEIATLYGVPDFMLNSTEKSTTWGSGLEQLFQAFVRITLKPRMSRITQMLNHELLPDKERRNTRFIFDTDQMTMGEFESRMTGYSTAIMSGVLAPDEARELEGRNPRPDGHGGDFMQPLNMTTGNNDAP